MTNRGCGSIESSGGYLSSCWQMGQAISIAVPWQPIAKIIVILMSTLSIGQYILVMVLMGHTHAHYLCARHRLQCLQGFLFWLRVLNRVLQIRFSKLEQTNFSKHVQISVWKCQNSAIEVSKVTAIFSKVVFLVLMILSKLTLKLQGIGMIFVKRVGNDADLEFGLQLASLFPRQHLNMRRDLLSCTRFAASYFDIARYQLISTWKSYF